MDQGPLTHTNGGSLRLPQRGSWTDQFWTSGKPRGRIGGPGGPPLEGGFWAPGPGPVPGGGAQIILPG